MTYLSFKEMTIVHVGLIIMYLSFIAYDKYITFVHNLENQDEYGYIRNMRNSITDMIHVVDLCVIILIMYLNELVACVLFSLFINILVVYVTNGMVNAIMKI